MNNGHSSSTSFLSHAAPHSAGASALSPFHDRKNSVLKIGNYTLGKTLGLGSFGKVKLATHGMTGNQLAVKILNRNKIKSLKMDDKIQREIQILKLFRHPHIIKLYEVIETATDIFMFMEYVSGGELFEYIVTNGRLSESETRRFFQQIISAVGYCHEHRVVHRDLKPENLLLDAQLNVKIADFGLSNIMEDGEFLKTSCGSPNYAAPEIISGQLYAGAEVDVWSCGVILYALLCGRLPFDDDYIPNLFKKIRSGVFTLPAHLSAGARDLIQKMLVIDPIHRITIPEIFEHPWFTVGLDPYLNLSLHTAKHMYEQNVDAEVVDVVAQRLKVPAEKVLAEMKRTDVKWNEFRVAYDLVYDSMKVYNDPNVSGKRRADVAHVKAMRSLHEAASVGISPVVVSDSPFDTMASTLLPTRRKAWQLGVISTDSPGNIMVDVMVALKRCNFEWKVVTSYSLRCRLVGDTSNDPIKIALQLFSLNNKEHLLDLKRVQGEAIPFFNECSRFLGEYRALQRSRSIRLQPFDSFNCD